MDENLIVKRILLYSKNYRKEHCDKFNKIEIQQDPLAALDFLFGSVFYGGISDEIATKERDITFNYIKENYLNKILDLINNNKNYSEDIFIKKLKNLGVRNSKRGKMVYGILKWISQMDDNNCINYSINYIKNKKIAELYNQLTNDIYFIGPKKTALFLRYLVALYDLNEFLTDSDIKYIVPIDTYINQFLIKMGLKEETTISYNNDIKLVLQWCKKVNISPIDFDQGVWYAYKNDKLLF